ncbi:response regulator transcription factor [Diaminobutyricibacter tongyongensis]|uniref:Response regulator transcription factor n=1 Tax=Leifsonia tongyongensis TaxID=1268043 RepID=A0A6L9XY96_9MICO|nr:response regulator transcription factor [Diaminobutyricibacter tongyongensis]NEN06401.1 response regulator transcription factor [Diaminobutyricibacter tongyongensis]
MRILVADDDPQILRALRIMLTARGYEVSVARNGAEALNQAVEHHPELVVLDLGMPGMSGIEVIEGLRGWTHAPILVVSGRTGSTDKVGALDAGADDYVTKPFAADELLARIRALTRRTPAVADEPVVRFGPISVDLAARQVVRATENGTEAVRLTPTEWQILEMLLRNPQRLVTRQSLLTEVWGPQYTNDTGYLRLYLAQLRKKLEPVPSQPRYLLTEPGMGYRFVPDPE